MTNSSLSLKQRVEETFGPLPYIKISKGLGSMTKFGHKLLSILEAGDAIGMVGELGAGKSNLVRVLVDTMTKQLDCFVTSPTYTIANVYPTTPQVAHLDLYRLKTEDDFYCLGGEEYFGQDIITLVEWADILPDVMPANTLWLGLDKKAGGEQNRRIIMTSSWEELQKLMERE